MTGLIKGANQLIKCPICGVKCRLSETLVLAEEKAKSVLHLTCGQCETSTLVFISIGKFGIASLKMITDLNRQEAKKLFQSEAVSIDQVIEMHQFLKSFKGEVKDFIK